MIPTLSVSDGIHSPVETHHKPKHWPYKEHLAFSIYTVFPFCGCQAFLDKSAAGSSDGPPSVTAQWRSLFSQASAQTSRRPATLGSRRETPSVGCSWEAFATHHQWNKHYACITYPLAGKKWVSTSLTMPSKPWFNLIFWLKVKQLNKHSQWCLTYLTWYNWWDVFLHRGRKTHHGIISHVHPVRNH